MMTTVSGEGIRAAVQAGKEAATLKDRFALVDFGDEQYPVILDGKGGVQVLKDLLAEMRHSQSAPPRIEGQIVLHEMPSFMAAINRWKRPETIIYSRMKPDIFEAVINEHEAGVDGGGAAWRDFTITMVLRHSEDYKRWHQIVAKGWSEAEEFAMNIEQDVGLVRATDDSPSAAALIEVARNLRIHTKGEFISSYDRSTGEYELVNKRQNSEASTRIPPRFILAMAMYQGGDVFEFVFALDMKLRDSDNKPPLFRVRALNGEAVRLAAIADMRDAIAKETGCPVWA